eukprot:1160791-Pelagomonas_calceolata.AAC.6
MLLQGALTSQISRSLGLMSEKLEWMQDRQYTTPNTSWPSPFRGNTTTDVGGLMMRVLKMSLLTYPVCVCVCVCVIREEIGVLTGFSNEGQGFLPDVTCARLCHYPRIGLHPCKSLHVSKLPAVQTDPG